MLFAAAAGLIFALRRDGKRTLGALLIAAAFWIHSIFPARYRVSVLRACRGRMASTAGAAVFQHFFVRGELRRSESEKSRYQQAIHWVAHEMRTPLTAIQGSSEIMTRYELPDAKRQELSEMINSESKRLARMIQTFLDVERLADGEMEMKREPFNICDVASSCYKRAVPIAERKKINVVLDTSMDASLVGDRELMEYALYNLLTNAIKYSPKETEVQVFARQRGAELRLSVSDQGMGMGADEVKKIFTKFYRTKGAEVSGEVGTGIGLSIVEQIVTHHGGRMEVASEPGKGSCFTMVLKAEVAARLPMQKLLIVEDDYSVRSTMVTCLELEGYAVDAVSSTHEAIERLRDQSYPIVISDIYLDERTGIDVLRSARAQNPSCAVILMTGRGSMETVMQATEGGAFEYLAKPFEMAQMISTIKRAEKTLAGGEDDHEAASIDDLPDTELIASSRA